MVQCVKVIKLDEPVNLQFGYIECCSFDVSLQLPNKLIIYYILLNKLTFFPKAEQINNIKTYSNKNTTKKKKTDREFISCFTKKT